MINFLQEKSKLQIRKIFAIAGAASGLHIFSSIFGDAGDFLSSTFSRIVLNYDIFVEATISRIGRLIGIDVSGYEPQIAFATIILTPYLIRWRQFQFGGYLDDHQKILGTLNFLAFTLIATTFNQWNFDPWAGWLMGSVVSLAFIGASADAILRDGDHLRTTRSIIFIFFLLCFGLSMLGLLDSVDHVFSVSPSITGVLVTIFVSLVYVIGVSSRIDGYYPFMTGMIFFSVLYLINLLLKDVFPAIDRYLGSIGV
ncbi:hypothetical protein [Mesorhizobium australicum]|uniref:hypothetical protein n=1 Tax=Mesorhizobium australicum TaxID=536018 RepID=UPI00111BED7C|nr:hypothetical protein [Mesorhizobium australicum]